MILRKCYALKRKKRGEEADKTPKERFVLFLDIDGVLQPLWAHDRSEYDLDALRETIAEHFNDPGYLKIDKWDIAAVFYDWDFISIGYLKRLLLFFDADIVLHSSWINYNNLENLKRLFRLHQLDDYLVDVTESNFGQDEDGTYRSKVTAITRYLEAHKDIKRYAIIDDDRSLEKLGDRFVRSPGKIDKETYLKLRETMCKE